MSRKRNRLLALLYGLTALCVGLSWGMVFGLDRMAAVPLGLCPILALAGGDQSGVVQILCFLAVLVIYVCYAAALWGVSRRRRWGTAGVVVILTVDLAANVVFTIASWWYLLAIGLDLVFLLLAYRLYRTAGIQ